MLCQLNYLACDECWTTTDMHDSEAAAREDAAECGWWLEEGRSLCPECSAKVAPGAVVNGRDSRQYPETDW